MLYVSFVTSKEGRLEGNLCKGVLSVLGLSIVSEKLAILAVL